jgi:sugar lactone lactonase YvrE
LTGFDTETAFPNASYNNPPGGAVDYTKIPTVTKGLSNYLLGVQSVVIDYDDVLWILDTGRARSLANLQSPMLPASPSGTKLISVDLTTNTVTRTYTFPTTVARPDSYFNDVRIDTVRRFAYISDSSDSQDNALVVLNLETGDSWRVLQNDPTVRSIPKTLPFVYGEPLY